MAARPIVFAQSFAFDAPTDRLKIISMIYSYRYGLALGIILHTTNALPPYNITTTYKVWFTHQSQHTSLIKWLEMFILCLAPLITHIAFGLAKQVIIGSKGLTWRDQIGLFNPVSIVWRYYAIVDRRWRAKHWDEADMAASNSIFWDGKQFDGSEAMMVRSRDWITTLPPHHHVEILSGSALASLAITIQGVQAIVFIATTFTNTNPNAIVHRQDGLPYIFQVLAIVGLLRLPAAFWISSDYGYAKLDRWEELTDPVEADEAEAELQNTVAMRLNYPNSQRGIYYRIWWALSMLFIMGISLGALITGFFSLIGNRPAFIYSSTTGLLYHCFYIILSAGCLIIHWVYIFTGYSGSTVIPCMHSLWYKGYTFLLWGLGTLCVLVASLETRIAIDGSYTTYPEVRCDMNGVCHHISAYIIYTNASSGSG